MGIHVDAKFTAIRAQRAFSLLFSLLLLFGGWTTLYAGSLFQVTKTEDSNDGACDSDCSLREAIIAANSNPGLDTVGLPAGTFTLSIPGSGEDLGATGDLDISELVLILGQGPTATIIDATGLNDRIFHVDTFASQVWIQHLSMTGGNSPADGGAISNRSPQLVLTNVVVQGNTCMGSGGGVYSGWAGEVTIESGSVIADNSAGQNFYGGGLSVSVLTMTESSVTGNSSGVGGGISTGMDGGTTTISGSTISGNSTSSGGGGIFVENATAQVNIENCTIHNNASGQSGGAIWIGGSATVTLHSTTLTDNSAAAAGSALSNYGQLTLTNTLITGVCFGTGVFSSNGGNLESPGNTCTLTGPGDIVDVVNPMLSPLAFNGGPTPTRLPLLGSPAIDGGSDTSCLSLDQRGEPRSDGSCDVGSLERQPADLDPLFFDGFESSDTSNWSQTAP
jgi:CSLREA domain-containing protein